MDQPVKDRDQGFGIYNGSPDALGDLAEALARCSRESSFGKLEPALYLVARILKAADRLLVSHSGAIRFRGQ